MKFFFADNCDWVDPLYDFGNDQHGPQRQPQIDDQYPHEYFDKPPYDGILVSRSIVGGGGFRGKYTQPQRHRFLREGAHRFLRCPSRHRENRHSDFPLMGDCGSFSYIEKPRPTISNSEMVEFYQQGGFTMGVSVDHIITSLQTSWDDSRRRPTEVEARAEFSYRSAVEFIGLCRELKTDFTPIGAVQSWSPKSAARYATRLVEAGYTYVGLGGLVGQPWHLIYNTVGEVRSSIPDEVDLHVFGVSCIDNIHEFQGMGITSIDSTGPMLKAFKDDKDNYLARQGKHYTAVRVPPATETKTNRPVQSGMVDQDVLIELERIALGALNAYENRETDLESVLKAVNQYEAMLFPGRDLTEAYRRTLGDRPWERCPCRVCAQVGLDVVVYRGANRNKRRGFHNLFTFHDRVQQLREEGQVIQVPCIRTEQSPRKFIYSFVVDGKQIPKFARVSRIGRNEDGILHGYQRPEVLEHINEIRSYLDSDGAILPNSIVVAFQNGITFEPMDATGRSTEVGTLNIDVSRQEKPGWIVDGQQRVAALRSVRRASLPVSVVAFDSENAAEEREQFVLVNSSKPLPKSLVYELLPSMEKHVPPRLKKRQEAYRLLERLNLEDGSPFNTRIRTTTSKHMVSANIKDLSVLKMLENSLKDGILFRYQTAPAKAFRLLRNYWAAVRARYSEAWELPPKSSRLTHGVGIVSMGYVMDTVAYRLVGNDLGIPRIEKFADELARLGDGIPWTDGVWEFSRDTRMPWNALQNTNAHIELLTNHLIRKYRRAA